MSGSSEAIMIGLVSSALSPPLPNPLGIAVARQAARMKHKTERAFSNQTWRLNSTEPIAEPPTLDRTQNALM